MIVFDLQCRKGHGFEAWFQDTARYDTQVAAGEVSCPTCGTTKVEKALMAPVVSGAKKKSDSGRRDVKAAKQAAAETAEAAKLRRALGEMRDTIEKNFDYVGGAFPEEARKIHYGEAESRNIYGETSEEEAKALDEEGVGVQRVPWLPRENS